MVVRAHRPSVFQAGHIPSCYETCERGWVLPVADGCGWLLLLLSVSVGRNPIPAQARRDAVCCSGRCRQARHRFLHAVGHAEAVAPGRSPRFVYADPPYPGKAWFPLSAWEPVIYHGGRQLPGQRRADSIACGVTRCPPCPATLSGPSPPRCAGGSSRYSAPGLVTSSMTCIPAAIPAANNGSDPSSEASLDGYRLPLECAW
jgi:hypothetical protein